MFGVKCFDVSIKTPKRFTPNASAFLKFAMAKNIFATACSVPLASLSEEKGTGEKNIKYEKHPSKSQNHLTN